ncbi:hypothetical protein BLOT_003235 [Blomia tropicalis]|nr:hypothetical protein BLOT_003235 [Blomia tropicalis]
MASSSNSSKPSFMSLADILQSTSGGVRTRSSDKVQLGFDLKKNLESINQSNSKLNISRALDQVSTESFNFININQQLKQADNVETKPESNLQILEKPIKLNRRQIKKEDRSNTNSISFNSYGNPLDMIKKVTTEIDKRTDLKGFDFDEKNKQQFDKFKPPGFNLIQLPKDFTLDRGRVNLYQSGIIEVISNDNPPRKFRFKPPTHEDNMTSDLAIATDTQVLLERAYICSTDTL